MRASFDKALRDIESASISVARSCVEPLFYKHGGIADEQLRIEKLIADLGPRRAAELSLRFVQLKRQLKRLYGLRPNLAVEHVELTAQLFRRGWLRLR